MSQTPNPSFFTIARQGRNTWQDYLKGWLTIFGMTIVMEIVAIVVLSVFTEFSLDVAEELIPYLVARPLQLAVFGGLIVVGLLLGLFLAVERIHQRHFWTLLSPRPQINWLRVVQGFGVWFGLSVMISAIAYLIHPARYDLTFVASEWIPWAIAGSLCLPVLLLTALLLIYGYLLQGLSLLIRRPVLLLTVWSILIGILNGIDSPQQWFVSTLLIAFWALIIYQDDGLELLLGLYIANAWIQTLIIGQSDALISNPYGFEIPTVFTLTSQLPPAIAFLITVVKIGAFYFLCFRYPWSKVDSLSA